MAIKAAASVSFSIYGDSISKQVSFNVANMATPAPFKAGLLPTGLGNVKAPGFPGLTATLSDGHVLLMFDYPPPKSPSVTVTIEFLYGGDT